MEFLQCTRPGQLDYGEKDIPGPAPDQVLLAIRRVGVCGTDLHAVEGTQPFFQYPRILGHELAAEVVTPRGDFRTGDTVTLIPYLHCGHCAACRAGKTNCCANLQVIGVHIDGGMTEFLAVPASSLLSSQGLGLDELVLVEPFAIAAHGIRRAALRPGEWVMVMGCGPIGIALLECARLAGARTIAIDRNPLRLDYCRNTWRTDHQFSSLDEGVLQQIREITGGDLPAAVIDATGSLQAINRGFDFVAPGGRYVLVGLQKGDILFSHPDFHRRECTLMSSRNATRADFEWVMDAMRKKQLNTGPYISQYVRFGEVKDQFPHWLDPQTAVVKTIIVVDPT